jgi:hypothetical protein
VPHGPVKTILGAPMCLISYARISHTQIVKDFV